MKKIITVFTFTLLCNLLHAQKKEFYIEPQLSIGTSNVTQRYVQPPFSNTGYNKSNKINFTLGALAGLKIKRWRAETGLQFMSTGYKLKDVYFGPQYNDIRNSSISYGYTHLCVPLQLSYAFDIYENITLEPVIGMAAGLNLGQSEVVSYRDNRESLKMSDRAFNYRYKKGTLWANAGFNFEFKIDSRYALVTGGTFQYMLTNFIRTSQLGYYFAQHNYVIMFSMGVRIKLP